MLEMAGEQIFVYDIKTQFYHIKILENGGGSSSEPASTTPSPPCFLLHGVHRFTSGERPKTTHGARL